MSHRDEEGNQRDAQEIEAQSVADTERPTRAPYEAPKVMKKRSVARVTLFSGTGVAASGLPALG